MKWLVKRARLLPRFAMVWAATLSEGAGVRLAMWRARMGRWQTDTALLLRAKPARGAQTKGACSTGTHTQPASQPASQARTRTYSSQA